MEVTLLQEQLAKTISPKLMRMAMTALGMTATQALADLTIQIILRLPTYAVLAAEAFSMESVRIKMMALLIIMEIAAIGICQAQSLAELSMTVTSQLMNFAAHAVEEEEDMILALQMMIVIVIFLSQMNTETIAHGTLKTLIHAETTTVVLFLLMLHAVPVVVDLVK